MAFARIAGAAFVGDDFHGRNLTTDERESTRIFTWRRILFGNGGVFH
jgi:hypothetical protein